MASAAETTPGEPYGAGSADGDPPVRMSPEAQAELRVRIAHQVASALQDPRRGRGHDATYSSDGSWSSILAYAGLSVGGVGVGGGGAHVEPTPPPIQPGVLPEVLLADFDPYLRRMRGVGAGAGGERANVESEDESVHPEASSSRRPAFSSDPEPAPRGRTAESDAGSGSAAAAAAAADDPLRLVPPAFFEEAFELSDPAVFAGVCGDAYAPDATHVSIAARRVIETRNGSERDASVRRVPSEKTKNEKNDATARLQETLGKHLDVVETRLTNVLSSRSAQFMDAATQINQLVDAVERARVTCAGARRVAKNADSLVSGAFRELDALHRLRSNLGSIERACDVLTKLRDARLDLALFVEAEEHAGALEAAEEVRAIQKDPALVGVACAGEALTRNVAEIERLCGAEIAQQWRDCALLPRGATAQRGGGAPAPEHCFAIVGAAARDAGLSPPPAGEWERVSRRGDSDDDDDLMVTKDAFWGESRGGLGPDERAFADAATNVYPRLTRALRASCVGEASNASVSAGGVAGDAMRLWADAAAKDVASATRRAARAALVAAGALRGDAISTGEEEENLPEALGALPETVLARVLEAVASAAHEHFARAAMCATWARRALGVETTTDFRTGSASSLPRVDSSVSATSASSAASEGTDADAGEAGEAGDAGDAGEAGFDTLETAFGFETFDAAEKMSAESDDARARDARAAAVSVACAASEAASSTSPRRRAAIASAASDAARRVADAAQRSFADLLAGFESEPTERPNDASGARGLDDDDFFSDARDHLSSVEVCESFARAAETLGRRRCLALRSAVTRRSARWLARFGAAAARKMRDALEAETWTVPEGETTKETTKKVVASASFLSRAAEAYLRVARRAPALAPDVARRLNELVRAYNARSCRLVLGAEATRGGARLKSVTAAHLAATHGALRLAAAGALRDARRELAPLLRGQQAARRDVWEKEAAKTARDLDAHCAEIRAKLVGIMRERCEARCAEIRARAAIGGEGQERRAGDPLAADACADGGEAHAGMKTQTAPHVFAETAEAVARELGTIGRVVGERIDGADADDVLSEIAAVFDAGLEAALVSVRSEDRSEDRSEANAALVSVASVARSAAAALARLTARDESEAAPSLTRLGATVAADTEGGPER